MSHRTATALALAVAIALCGCERPAPAPPVAVPAEVIAMSIAQKQELIAPNFQIEVPIPMGEVVRAEAQGDSAWDYELIVAAPPTAIASWYEKAFVGREWVLEERTSSAQGTYALTFTKNRAQTRVTVAPEGGSNSRVKAVLGVGTPVLQMQ
jgi:hypothetical protein